VRLGKVLQVALRNEVVSSSCHRAIPISAALDCPVSRKSHKNPLDIKGNQSHGKVVAEASAPVY
jgi:hypothetical protein